MSKSRGYVYEHDRKTGLLLAWQLKCQAVSRQIPQIRKSNGELTIDLVEIKESFASFYSNLYESEATNDNIDMQHFFDNLQAPIINTISQD